MAETNEPRPEQDPAAAFERRRKQKVWIAGAAASILSVLLVGRILGGGEKAQQERVRKYIAKYTKEENKA